MAWLILFVVTWGVCGVFAYAVFFAYFQREFPLLAEMDYGVDRRKALTMGLSGPVGLLTTLIFCGFKHGLKFK